MSEISRSGYCAKCQRKNAAVKNNRCSTCGRLIWELMAKPCDTKNPLRTTKADYAALVKFAR